MVTKCHQNFHKECERATNEQINKELHASYVYLSMTYYFDRKDVALPGMFQYFKKAADQEHKHAMKYLTYLNKRGGRIILKDIKNPAKEKWGTADQAMQVALLLEKQLNESLLEMYAVASSHKDKDFCHFLRTEFLQEQVDSIKEIADHVTNLQQVREGLGVYIVDKQLMKEPHLVDRRDDGAIVFFCNS